MKLARFTAVTATAVGLLVLSGWMFHLDTLTRLWPGLIRMKPLAATGLAMLGVALWLLVSRPRPGHERTAAVILSALVFALGAVTLVEYLTGWYAGIDLLLFPAAVQDDRAVDPGRMSVPAAIDFTLLGLAAILAVVRRTRVRIVQGLATAAGVLALFTFITYTYDAVADRPAMGEFTPMALHTAMTFMLLSIGFASLDARAGLIRYLTAPGPGGLMARSLLPVAVLVPALLGWLQLSALHHGWVGVEMAIAMRTTTIMLVLLVVIWISARSLERVDEVRRATEEENRRYARFFSMSVEMFGISGFDGYFKVVSPSWERILGYTREEILAVPYAEFIHPEDRERLKEIIPKIRDGSPHEAIEIRYRRKDGSYRWFSWNVIAVPAEHLSFSVGRDITPLKETMMQLESVNRELDGFARSVSHDLRAPVRAVDGFARLLEEDYAGALDDEGRRLLTVIRRSSHTMGQLIDDLLAFSRVSRQEREPVRVAMRELARGAAADAQSAEPARTIALELGDLPEVEGDRAMLRQVWFNLIANAVKFTRHRPEPRIVIRGAERDGLAHFEVSDNGSGFDPRYRDKLFGVFQRLHSAEEFEGTGVGLALVKRIIERHGGSVDAEGRPGEGATFSFALPRAAGPGGVG